jgi:hypothetical protein
VWGRYEIVILNKVAHHLGVKLESTLRQLVSKLAAGGSIVIWDFNWPASPSREPDNDADSS